MPVLFNLILFLVATISAGLNLFEASVIEEPVLIMPPTPKYHFGIASFYGTGSGSDRPVDINNPGMCGSQFIPSGNLTNYFVALAQADYSTELCGKCLYVSQDGTGPVIKTYIADMCPSSYCSSGKIDISAQTFFDLAGSEARGRKLGLMKVKHYIDVC